MLDELDRANAFVIATDATRTTFVFQGFEDQADLRGLSTRSEQRIVEGVTHISLTLEHPEVIVTAVRDILAAIENASEVRRTHS